jgi:hypothetical protein
VVLVDPPPFESLEALARTPYAGPGGPAPFATGFIHLVWSRPELELSERCLTFEWQIRGPIGHMWRGLKRTGGEASDEPLRELLAGPGRHPRAPEVAARCIGVLHELGLCEWQPGGPPPTLRVLSSDRTQLERSRAYGACIARHEEGKRYLRSRAQT